MGRAEKGHSRHFIFVYFLCMFFDICLVKMKEKQTTFALELKKVFFGTAFLCTHTISFPT